MLTTSEDSEYLQPVNIFVPMGLSEVKGAIVSMYENIYDDNYK
jgi:hypothetical protein